MSASAGVSKRHAMPTLPRIPEAVRERLTGERLAEAGITAATIAAILILSTALQYGLEQYVIAGL